ncbi:MAG: hypothetical protein A3K19_01525 [Lentisphaerae bacterium RIFOXYB12_FULL_65_16]|nr:MAG: hypothetical protein A3K18_22880 [Lentisphaerae bacterium RIFOXYA12_64_32]OGV92820.1 MAG: hypothetical protein A3K19_01525 [Lentisphaerae bacterium RIFOXYB12_FULL_65_16]
MTSTSTVASPTLWSDPTALDECFMSAGDDNPASLRKLTDALSHAHPPRMADWPAPVREAWQTGAELVVESLNHDAESPDRTALLHRLAVAGFDSVRFRDALAKMARRHFSSYLDPAGLLTALGIHDHSLSTERVVGRWDVMRDLHSGARVWHAAHGHGAIAEVDATSNEVHVQFERRQKFTLDVALDSLWIVRTPSVLASLMTGEMSWQQVRAKPNTLEALRQSMSSAQPTNDAIMERILVPTVMPASTFAALIGAAPEIEAEAPPAPPAPDVAPGSQRAWHEARGIAELVDLLRRETKSVAPPPTLDTLRPLLLGAAPRADQVDLFGEAVARLWTLTHGADWLQPVLRESAPLAQPWEQLPKFIRLTDKLPGSLLLPWAQATLFARGTPYTATACTELPVRLWGYFEKALGASGDAKAILVQEVLARTARNDASADMLIWLWKTDLPQKKTLANPELVFRTLTKVVRGSFLKAKADLHRLLMDNETFHRHILRDGDPEAVRSLVRCIRHIQLLDVGEKQSLLVKIVRLYPEARPLVEERRAVVSRRPIGKVTSPRSFELRRRELEDIINTRIPTNSRAIATAREHGDLRENAEFKAAKEEQAYLTARRAELENDLHEIRPTDFADIVVRDAAVPGSTLTLKLQDGHEQVYHLLGLWDSIPEKSMISYDTPMGKNLLGVKVGSRFTLPGGEEAELIAVSSISDELREWLKNADM